MICLPEKRASYTTDSSIQLNLKITVMEAWANALILIMLSVGHAELWITLINRTHSYPIHEPILKRIRHVHDVLIVSFPLILFLTVGLYTPGVLREGHGANFLYCGYLFSCCVGWAFWDLCILY